MTLSRKITSMAIAASVAVAISALAGTCSSSSSDDGALYGCDRFALYPDSLVTPSLTVVARPDGIALTDHAGTRLLPIATDDGRGIVMTGKDSLINYLFNLPDTSPRVEWTTLTPYIVWLSDAIAAPDAAASLLSKRIADGRLISAEVEGYRWPVVSDDGGWGAAVRETALTCADETWVGKAIAAAENDLDRDTTFTFNRLLNLFSGISTTDNIDAMPRPVNAATLAATLSLGRNIDGWCMLNMLAENAGESRSRWRYTQLRDSLGVAIGTFLWLPQRNCLSNMLYNYPAYLQSPFIDNLAQGWAVATGAITPPAAKALVSFTPVTKYGFETTAQTDSQREALTAALWTIAAAKTGNEKMFALMYSSLAAMTLTEPIGVEFFRGATLRGLLGISLSEEGMTVSPFIPAVMGKERTIRGLRFRNSVIDLEIMGTGSVVSTFMIDGEIATYNVIPSTLTGHHTVRVNLSGFPAGESSINISQSLPPDPQPELIATAPCAYSVEGTGDQFTLYVNGELNEVLSERNFILPRKAPVTALAVSSASSDHSEGYASSTCLYIPPTDSTTVKLDKYIRKGTRTVKKKTLAKELVESSRYRNPSIKFDYRSNSGGRYYVQLVYRNGLGIVNPDRRYALRTLAVNGVMQGLMILSQLSPDNWRNDIDWWTFLGHSLPMPVTLQPGINHISVDYFAPADADFDHDTNILLPVGLTIIKRHK